MNEYIYLGDRFTRPELQGALCSAVRDKRGKCIVGRGKPAGSLMRVRFADGTSATVLRRMLRKIKPKLDE